MATTFNLTCKNQKYLASLKTEIDKAIYEVSYFAWDRIDTLKQYRLEQPVYSLAIDDFIKNGVHTFECNVVAPDEHNDHYIVSIADALMESKKAKKITLHFGLTSDNAMQYFLKAVKETKAPLESIEINTVRGVTDNTWKLLPELIKSKNITINVEYVRISDEVKEQINMANASVANTKPKTNTTILTPRTPEQKR